MYKYNKDEIKENLSIEDVFELVAALGGEPHWDKSHEVFIAQTICHNHVGEGSHKLYYYGNTKLFHCFTDCDPPTFDIFELVKKVRSIAANAAISLPEAIAFVASYFGISPENEDFLETQENLQDWKILDNYQEISSKNYNKTIAELRIFDDKILKNLPQPHIVPWEKEGIKYEVMVDRGIRYDPSSQSVVIPHYDMNGNLIGIRGRTLIKEDEQYGKYRPLYINKIMYNHPLGFALYNLNKSKDNIQHFQTAILAEGEKSCMQYASYFGMENDITCAVCGSSFISYQAGLLQNLGVKQLVIAFDKQFEDIKSPEAKRWCDKLREINRKYSPYFSISFLFDKWNLLDYKNSPFDKGPDVFMELFKRRIIL